MKRISYLIARLEKIKETEGDLPVTLNGNDDLLDLKSADVVSPDSLLAAEPVVTFTFEKG